MLIKQILGTLGIARLAGKVTYGEKASQSISHQTAQLVLLATDASTKTKKRIQDKCKYYAIPVYDLVDTQTLSQAVGQTNLKYLAIEDAGLAKSMRKNIEDMR